MILLLGGGGLHSTLAQTDQFHIKDRHPLPKAKNSDWKDCGLRKVDVNAFTSVRPAVSTKQSRTATFEVTYSGFTPEAREAFERAVSIWETHISSEVPIRISASYEELDPRTLGGTSPNFVYSLDTDEDGEVEVSVVDALADALSGEDQQPSGSDFSIVLNSNRDDWHFGEGDAPGGAIDFTSVALHEIAHGLGYLDATNISNEEGLYGINFDGVDEPVPLIYTAFVAQNQGGGSSRVFLTNESEFPNPSVALGDALTGDQLVFDGRNAGITAAIGSGPVPPKIYAPTTFNPGSSISHLDEDTYPFGGTNALMTPLFNAAETNRLPGPIVCGQLRDMFWPLGQDCQRYFSDVYALQFTESTDPANGSVTLSWRKRANADINEFVVEQRYFDGSFTPVERVPSSTSSDTMFTATLDSLGLGTFAFRVRGVRSDTSMVTTPQTIETTFRVQTVGTEIESRDAQARADVSVSWEVPPGTEGFNYRLERQTASSSAFSAVATVEETELRLERQTPGRYTYRVTATDGAGNTVPGQETETVEVDFDGAVYILGPYPNPVQETASIDLTARSAQTVEIGLYNEIGERLYIEELQLGAQSPEFLRFDASQWSSGLYFLRVRGDDFVKTRRMIVVR